MILKKIELQILPDVRVLEYSWIGTVQSVCLSAACPTANNHFSGNIICDYSRFLVIIIIIINEIKPPFPLGKLSAFVLVKVCPS
jgi:hypothetical protein